MGEVLQIPDRVTKFDFGKYFRPCLIVALTPPPGGGVWVVPRTTQGPHGVHTPAGTLPGLSKDGWFLSTPHRVEWADIQECASLGMLPEPYLTRALENVQRIPIELDGAL